MSAPGAGLPPPARPRVLWRAVPVAPAVLALLRRAVPGVSLARSGYLVAELTGVPSGR